MIEAKASLSESSGMNWHLGSTIPPWYILHGFPSLSSCLPFIPLTQEVEYIFEIRSKIYCYNLRTQD